MRKKNPKLKPLPAPFYVGENLNVELLTSIFQVPTQPSGFSKKVARLIQPEVPRKHEERVGLIGNNLEDTGFRMNWYQLMDSKRSNKKGWAPLYQLINYWVRMLVPEMVPHDLERRRLCFRNDKDGREFLQPTAVPALLAMAFDAGIDTSKVALYLWSYAEAAAWKEYEPAQFDADQIYCTTEGQSELSEYCSKVNELFQHPVLLMGAQSVLVGGASLDDTGKSQSDLGSLNTAQKLGVETRLSIPLSVSGRDNELQNEDSDLKSDELGKKDEGIPFPLITPEGVTELECFTELHEVLGIVEGAWKEYLLKIDGIISTVAELKRKPISDTIINNLELSVPQMTGVRQSIKDSIETYSTLYKKCITSLGRQTVGNENLVVSKVETDVHDIEQWLREREVELETLNICHAALSRYCDCTKNLRQHGIITRLETPFSCISDLKTCVDLRIEKCQQLYLEQEGIEKIRRHCASLFEKQDWNPFADDVMKSDGWKVLSHLETEVVDKPFLSGVVLRVLIDEESVEYKTILHRVTSRWSEDLAQTCKILSVLSRLQLERLWGDEVHLRPALTLCVLNTWLSACNSNAPSTMDYWYWEPLKEASTNANVGGSAYEILREIKELFRRGYIHGSNSLHRLLARLGKGDENAKVNPNDLYDQVNQRILKRQNYGGNYGRLANLAYEELFFPLKDAIVTQDINGLRGRVDKIDKEFDFSTWFARNSGKGERHVQVASQHKKKINQYICERLDILHEWLDSKSGPTTAHVENIQNLKAAVTDLMSQYDDESSNTTNGYLTVLGWWVNKLQSGNALIPSANNPSGELDGLPVESALVDEHEFPWRCIDLQVDGSMPTWEKYIADVLSLWSYPNVTKYVLEQWQESDQVAPIRFYMRHCIRRDIAVPANLAKWVEKREAELKRSTITDLKEIQVMLESFQSDTKQLFKDEYDDIKQCLDTEDWHALKARAEYLKEEVRLALEKFGDHERRQQVIDDIHLLGGAVSKECELLELECTLNELLHNARDRMGHTVALADLLQVPGLPENLLGEIENITKVLNQPRYLPNSKRSEWLKYITDTVFTPFTKQLENPGILRSEYREVLYRLLSSLIKLINNPEWVLEPDSGVEKLLVQVSDRIEKENCIDSILGSTNILEWLIEQSHQLGVCNLDADWPATENKVNEQASIIDLPPQSVGNNDNASDKSRRFLTREFQRYSSGYAKDPSIKDDGDEQIEVAILTENWDKLSKLCLSRIGKHGAGDLSDTFMVGAGLTVSRVVNKQEATEVIEALLIIFDRMDGKRVSSILTKKRQKSEKNPIGVVAVTWLIGQDLADTSTWRSNDKLIGSAAVHLARVLGQIRSNVNTKMGSPLLDILWDYASNESWGADFRAFLLQACTRGGLLGAVVYLLRKDPVRMEQKRAELFAGLVERATDEPGWERLSSFLESERNKQRSKPFTLFAEQLLAFSRPRKDHPATIEVKGTLVKEQGKNLWIAVIDVTPSVQDPPQDIVLRVLRDSPVTFGLNRDNALHIKGPFLDQKQLRIVLNVKESLQGKVPVEVRCSVNTLQDVRTEYTQTLMIDTGKVDENFCTPSSSSIEQCFEGFPYVPMRGKDYIPRDEDEKCIEDSMFNSERAESLWITSPRRSGKTTMLFHILDEFSYKKGRDDIVLYFTLDSPFDGEKAFNSWIWRRTIKGRDNRGLKDYIPNLEEIGATLDLDVDVDTFLSDYSSRLLNNVQPGARVYFVIDEIDRFAEMYLDGGVKRDTAMKIMWQLRNFTMNETNAGLLFAGSHAARRFFVSDASSPFYNSISSINLAPFNVDNEQNERRTRAIVQPKSMATLFRITNETLRHLLRITAGIPYYMKLLAGATYASSAQSQIFIPDINEGVNRMLSKETGIKKIDMLENPGEDELRTLYANSASEKALIKGVLLSVANIRSPIGGHPVNVGEIWSAQSPLVVRAGLDRELIEPAILSARNMGFLKTLSSNEYQVEFSIPLLGESLRRRFNVLWADIERHLEKLGSQ